MRARVATGLILLLAVAGMTAGVQATDIYVPPSTRFPEERPRLSVCRRRRATRDDPRRRASADSLHALDRSPQLIGDPDFGYVAYKTGANGRVPAKRIWNYILVKKALAETAPRSRVVVWFDANEKVEGVTAYGAPDIEPLVSRRGEPCT